MNEIDAEGMIEIRIHGRGGQGGVTLAELSANGFNLEGKDVRAFGFFGGERRGAPITAFVRVSDKKIFARHQIYKPDYVIVLEPSLIISENVLKGLKEGGTILINTPAKPDEFDLGPFRIITIDATRIALKHGLGTETNPLINTAVAGALAKVIGAPAIEKIAMAIEEIEFPRLEENIRAAKEAFEEVKI